MQPIIDDQHFHHTVEIKRRGEWIRVGQVTYPFSDCLTLDDSLDYGQLTLTGIRERKMNFKPFELLRINTYYQDKLTPNELRERKYWQVSAAKRVQRTFDKVPYLYDYVLEIIEPTKELERCIVDTMTVTIPKGHDYISGALSQEFEAKIRWRLAPSPDFEDVPSRDVPSMVKTYSDAGFFEYPKTQLSLYNINTTFDSVRTLFNPQAASESTLVVNETLSTLSTEGEVIKTADINSQINVPNAGTYSLMYQMRFDNISNVDIIFYFTNTFNAIENVPQKTAPTITYVINRLLSAGVTRTKSTSQKYKLHPAIAEKYDSVLSPEFYFTRSTLRDALTQVGNWDIHAIPRYDYFEAGTTPNGTEYPEGWYITYDELGGDEESPLPKSRNERLLRKNIEVPLVGLEEYITCDNYCGGLDSYAENILNTRNLVEGAVTEPSYNGWKTTRTEEGFLIQNDTSMIATTKPVYRVTALYIQYNNTTYDLTPWVFEEAQYDTMTGFEGSYPYAKEYALVYKQGDVNIRGLQFKATTLTGAFNSPTIENIMKDAFGVKITEPYKNLKFRVIYIPILTMRVSQKKANTGWDNDNVLFNNQSANSVESEWYGASLKGKLAMLGNETEVRTYSFAKYEDVPHCGEIVNGKYVAQIARQFDPMTIRATLTLTKDFNKLNEYNAINSSYRIYDISEQQSIDRDAHRDEIFTIGDQEEEIKTHLTDDATANFFQTLERVLINPTCDPTCMIARGEFDSGVELNPVCLPVSSLSFGNSMLFSATYESNYGAGRQSIALSPDAKPDAKTVAEQKLVQYTDVNGELQYLNLRFSTSMRNDSGTGLANRLPELLPSDFNDPFFDTRVVDFSAEEDWWVVEKDNREALRVGYQLHGQCNRSSIVMGTRLFADNPLVTKIDWTKKPVLAFLTERLSLLRPRVDVTKAIDAGGNVAYTRQGRDNLYVTVTADAEKIKQFNVKSWVLYDPAEGTPTQRPYYIGENIQYDDSGEPVLPPIYFNF